MSKNSTERAATGGTASGYKSGMFGVTRSYSGVCKPTAEIAFKVTEDGWPDIQLKEKPKKKPRFKQAQPIYGNGPHPKPTTVCPICEVRVKFAEHGDGCSRAQSQDVMRSYLDTVPPMVPRVVKGEIVPTRMEMKSPDGTIFFLTRY